MRVVGAVQITQVVVHHFMDPHFHINLGCEHLNGRVPKPSCTHVDQISLGAGVGVGVGVAYRLA